MPVIECKEENESGREYLLELGSVILKEMTPKVTSGLTPALMTKMKNVAAKLGPDKLETMSQWELIAHMDDLTEEETKAMQERLDDDEIGPEVLKICLRKVKSKGDDKWGRPDDLINPFTDEPYGTRAEFVDRDEDLVKDLPALIGHVKVCLENYYAGLAKRGELRPSSKS